MNEDRLVYFTEAGLDKFVKIVKLARGRVPYSDFALLIKRTNGNGVAISGATIWKWENREVRSIKYSSLEAISRFTSHSGFEYSLSVEELVSICTWRTVDKEEYKSYLDVIPILDSLSDAEIIKINQYCSTRLSKIWQRLNKS